MRISIRNLTSAVISTPLGQLDPAGSLVSDVPEVQLEGTVTELAKLGSRVSFSVGGSEAGDSITSPLTLYVETTGDDNNPGTIDKPFKTIQKAVDSLVGRRIAAEVIIQIGAGTFDAFQVHTLDFSRDGRLIVRGTATVDYSGVASSFTNDNIRCVLNDSGASFTVDQHIEKLIRYQSAATELNKYRPIIANTSTTIDTLLQTGTNVAYEIISIATIIQPTTSGMTGIRVSSNLGGRMARFQSGTGYSSALPSSLESHRVQLECLRVNMPAAGSASALHTSGHLAINGCILDTTAHGNLPTAVGPGVVMFSGCIVLAATSGGGSGAVNSNFGNNGYTTTLIYYSYLKKKGNIGTGTWVSVSGECTLSNVVLEGANLGVSMGKTRPGQATVWSRNCTTGIQVTGIHSAVGGRFDNTTTGILVSSGGTALLSSTLAANTCTTVISATTGGRIQFPSATTTSFTAVTNELSVDGVAYTRAAMQANSPKIVPLTPNAYGSYIYE